MTLNPFVKLLTALSVFSAVMLTSTMGKAQDPTPTANWVNIKSPAFGAYGDGKHDDTAAIQAAIDYAFTHNMSAVYCPAGNYKTTGTIYLDPPNDMRVNYSSPPHSGQFTMAFFGDPASSGAHLSGCILQPNFNNAVAFVVGPGNGMRASDFAVVGPGGGYRGLQNSSGIGIGIAGAPGGATGTLIENTDVQNFYTLYMTDVNNACCLADSNTFRKVAGQNGAIGIYLYATQSFINDIVEPYLSQVTDGVVNIESHQVNIFGGNISASSGQSNSFPIASISGLFQGGVCTGGGWCFTTVVGTPGTPPDGYWGTAGNLTPVYNAYVINTAHYGLLPLRLLSWNATTNVATFGMWLPWLYANYGTSPELVQSPNFPDDIQAVSTLYAAEQVAVAYGTGFTIDGIHLENAQACTSLLSLYSGWGGQGSNDLRNIYFNYDISGVNTDFTQAEIYCQQAFPFIGGTQSSFSSLDVSLRIEGGNWDAATQPIIGDIGPFTELSGRLLGSARFNLRVFDANGYSYGQLGGLNDQAATVARGTGRWDHDYFLPASGTAIGAFYGSGHGGSDISSDFCGYEPCQDRTPNLSPTLYALVSSSLGALGSYPPIACRTVFKSLDWNTTTPAGSKLWLRSASCPGYSYGQNLTNTLVGGTITYSGASGSDVLYLDSKTLGWMFPGLGITIGSDTYTVTGVYPYLGYVTVISAVSAAGGPLTKNYSCSSNCSIGQSAFAWTAY